MADKESNVVEVEEKLEDIGIIECSICCGTFREPKILPCIHTFCVDCLRQTGVKSGKTPGDQMPCPLCRKEFTIPDTGYEGLQKNFFVERLLENKQILKPSSPSISCERCVERSEVDLEERGDHPPAEVLCTECRLKLCTECHKQHIENELSRDHTIIGLEAYKDLSQKSCLQFCKEHNHKLLQFYCHDCEIVVCTACFADYHKGHQGSDVDKVSNEVRQEIQRNLETMGSMIADLKVKQHERERSKNDFIRTAAEIEIEVNRKRNKLKELVDKDADTLLQELSLLRHQNMKENETKKDDIDTLMIFLESYSSYCRQIAVAGSSIDVCNDAMRLHNRASELKHLHSLSNERTSRLGVLLFEEAYCMDSVQTDDNIVGKVEEFNDTEEGQYNAKEVKTFEETDTEGEDEKLSRVQNSNCYTGERGEADSEMAPKEGEMDKMMEAGENLEKKSTGKCNLLGSAFTEISYLCRVITKLESEKGNLINKIKDLEKQIGLLQDIAYGRFKPAKKSGETRADYKLEFSSTLENLTCDNTYCIAGISILGNELFVSNRGGLVVVHDMKTLKFKRRFRISGLLDYVYVSDVKQCLTENCLYILTERLDLAPGPGQNEIIKINPKGRTKKSWSVNKNKGQLSVTEEGSVLFTVCYSSSSKNGELIEYSSDGKLLEFIPIIWDYGVENPRHAIKLTSSHYAVCHGTGDDALHRVCIIDADGIVLKYYGKLWNRQLLNCPCYLDSDRNGNILVIDKENSRILLLSSDLELRLTQSIQQSGECNESPKKAVFDECYGRMFIAVSRTDKYRQLSDELKVYTISH